MRTVLVIDDEFGVADVLSFALDDAGYAVATAANGREGLRKAKETLPDLIVLDFMMPIMDGQAALKAILSDESLKSIPVIMMSSVDEESIRNECKDFASFLRKPFPISQFLELVSSTIEG